MNQTDGVFIHHYHRCVCVCITNGMRIKSKYQNICIENFIQLIESPNTFCTTVFCLIANNILYAHSSIVCARTL